MILDRSQLATGSQRHCDPRFAPYTFIEHGAIMAANVLASPRAIEINVYVASAFVCLREILATNKSKQQGRPAVCQRVRRCMRYTHP